MPYGDRSGPQGQGSMTGRRMGYCAGGNAPGNAGGFGYGRGRGGGYGRGYGYNRQNFNVTPASETVKNTEQSSDEIADLRAEISDLKNGLNAILQRLDSTKTDEK
jgi:hypothetical protein